MECHNKTAHTATLPSRLLITAALLATLAGCVIPGGRINFVHYDGYMTADFADAGEDGAIGVIMIGTPYAAMTPKAGAAEIADAMTGANFGPHFPFRAATSATQERDGYSVVFHFGGKSGVALCAVSAVSPTGNIGLSYTAAFCKDGAALSYLSGVAPNATNTFKVAMRSVAIELFPLENADYQGCGARRIC